MRKTVLKKYARLIAGRGVNIQKGQPVVIEASLDQPEFIVMLTEACYRAGAGRVTVHWACQPLERLHNRYCAEETLSSVAKWEEERMAHYAETLPCRIYIESDDPEGLNGIDREKAANVQRARFKIFKPYRDEMEDKYQWCIAAVPGEAWAKRLFPGLSRHAAVEKLWEAILAASRVTDDPIAAWDAHNADLRARCAYLNGLGIEKLHYTAPNGTDLTVGMIPEAVFKGGSDRTRSGVTFNPNIPSEECYISPKKGLAEGKVVATMPLSYEGELIENFSITFRGGRAVEWTAEKNRDLLTKMIGMDETSGYLGECALVPFESPIRESGILFLNTLFDENAACHLALGRGFTDSIEGFEDRTLEECRALGINDSMIHVDFMIGCRELDIDAVCAGGRTVPVFRGGTWAF